MSFFYPTSATAARSRRAREKESHNNSRNASSSSHRRARDAPKARDERSPPLKPTTPPSTRNSIYSQQNSTIDSRADQSNVEHEMAAPAASPVLKAGKVSANAKGVYHLPYQLQTPAALQQYLDSDDEDEEDEDEDEDEGEDEEDEDDDEDEDEDGHEHEHDHNEKGNTSMNPIHISSGNEKETALQHIESKPQTPVTPTKISDAEESFMRPELDDLTPQPKAAGEKILSFQYEHKIPGQFPLTQGESPRSTHPALPHEKLKMSSSSVSLQDLPRYTRDRSPFRPSSPTFLSRSTSNIEDLPIALPNQIASVPTSATAQARAPVPMPAPAAPAAAAAAAAVAEKPASAPLQEQPLSTSLASLQERSFTPPAPVQSMIQAHSSPAFISPLPLRPAYSNQHVPPYTSPQAPAMPPMHQVLDMNQPPPPIAYYMPQQMQHYSPMGFQPRPPPSTDGSAWNGYPRPPQYQQQPIPHHSQSQHPHSHPHPQPHPQSHPHLHPHQRHGQQQQQQHHQPIASPPPPPPPLRTLLKPVEEPEDETILMLRRIQAVLPDFQTLLECYKDTSSRVGFDAEGFSEQGDEYEPTEAGESVAHEDRLVHNEKDIKIENLTREIETLTKKFVIERNRLRMQLGNLDEEKRNLQEDMTVLNLSHDKLEKGTVLLREQLTSLSTQSSQDKSSMEARIASLQEQLNIKTKAELSYTVNLTARDDVHKREMSEADSNHRRELNGLDNSHKKELAARDDAHRKTSDSLSFKLADEKRRHEEAVAKLRAENENLIRAHGAEAEGLRKSQAEAAEAWAKERTTIEDGRDKECREIKTQWEDHCRKLAGQHVKEREELQRAWEASQQKQLRRQDQLEDDKEDLKREISRMKDAWSRDKAKYAKTSDEFRAMASRLQSEHLNMQKMMESWNLTGEALDQRRSSH